MTTMYIVGNKMESRVDHYLDRRYYIIQWNMTVAHELFLNKCTKNEIGFNYVA